MDKNVHIFNLATYEKPEVVETPSNDWVEYGKNNDYYTWLIDRYKHSSTNNAIINNIARLIYGKGIDALNASKRPSDYAMLKSMISPKALRGVALNFKMLGQAYFQVLYNKKHTKIAKVDYIPTRLVRPAKCNEDGIVDRYFFSDDWSDVRNNEPIEYPAFGTSKKDIEIYCIKFDSVDKKYFNDVDYYGALPYCVLEEEISDFLINDVQNSFSGSKVINFNNGIPDEEAQRQISNQVKSKLTGAKGDRVIVAFNNNQESKTTIDDIALDNAPEHYSYLSEECQAKILNAHTVISPMIVGITNKNHGFSSNADEIETATKVFYNQSILPFQEAILEAIEEFLAFNGASLDIYFKRLNLMDSIEEKKQAQEEKEEADKLNLKEQEEKITEEFIDLIHSLGENESSEWELIDERDVDLDQEEVLNAEVEEWEKELQQASKKETTLSKIWKFATGYQSPNKESEQDKEIDGKFFKVRYVYQGNPSPQRKFCKEMMRAQKLYRKEDIDKLSAINPNKGFGVGGSDNYDVFKYKGGPRCRHRFVRRTYISKKKKDAIGSENTKYVSKASATNQGYTPTKNDTLAQTRPNDMPLKGFHPSNPNLPSDVK